MQHENIPLKEVIYGIHANFVDPIKRQHQQFNNILASPHAPPLISPVKEVIFGVRCIS
jgi:hypothetical protein